MDTHDIDPTPIALSLDPLVHGWPCRTCGLLVVDSEIHQRWAGSWDLSEVPGAELHGEIAAQRGIPTLATEE